MLLVIDNYDSFTYNLVQYLGELGARRARRAQRRDRRRRGWRRWRPTRIVISPGPARPTRRASASTSSSASPGTMPILGVCLGHQAIGQAFGGKVVRAPRRSCTARPRPSSTTARACSRASAQSVRRPRAITRWWSSRRRCRTASTCRRGRARARSWRLRHKTLPVEGRAVPPRVVPDRRPARSSCGTSSFERTAMIGARRRRSKTPCACNRSAQPQRRRDGRRGRQHHGRRRPRRPRSARCWSALRMKGETVDEVVGAARAMRARMTRLRCGRRRSSTPAAPAATARGSINVSTVAAFIVAGARRAVAKHGNRAQSSQSGSHDVLEALGLDSGAGPAWSARCLDEARLAFLFAPAYHARHEARDRRARKEMGLRTAVQPAGAAHQPGGRAPARERRLRARALRADGAGPRRARRRAGAGGARRGRPRRVRPGGRHLRGRAGDGRGRALRAAAPRLRPGRRGSGGAGRRRCARTTPASLAKSARGRAGGGPQRGAHDRGGGAVRRRSDCGSAGGGAPRREALDCGRGHWACWRGCGRIAPRPAPAA